MSDELFGETGDAKGFQGVLVAARVLSAVKRRSSGSEFLLRKSSVHIFMQLTHNLSALPEQERIHQTQLPAIRNQPATKLASLSLQFSCPRSSKTRCLDAASNSKEEDIRYKVLELGRSPSPLQPPRLFRVREDRGRVTPQRAYKRTRQPLYLKRRLSHLHCLPVAGLHRGLRLALRVKVLGPDRRQSLRHL